MWWEVLGKKTYIRSTVNKPSVNGCKHFCKSVFRCELFPDVKCTKQMRLSFFFSRADIGLQELYLWGGDVTGQHLKQMLMAITQTPHEPSMGACQGLWDSNHSLRTNRLAHTHTHTHTHNKTHTKNTDILRDTAKAREAMRDRDTQAPTFTRKMDLCVLLAFRQTNCLSVDNRASEVKVRSRPEIHLFKKKKKEIRETERGKCGKEKKIKCEWNRREWIRHLDRVIEIGAPQMERGHVN